MAHQCPRCGANVRRGTSKTAGFAGGAAGALIFAAVGPFQCKTCGPIPRKEFPEDVRRKMLLGSIALISIAAAILIALVVILSIYSK